jgi:hypothetical protein
MKNLLVAIITTCVLSPYAFAMRDKDPSWKFTQDLILEMHTIRTNHSEYSDLSRAQEKQICYASTRISSYIGEFLKYSTGNKFNRTAANSMQDLIEIQSMNSNICDDNRVYFKPKSINENGIIAFFEDTFGETQFDLKFQRVRELSNANDFVMDLIYDTRDFIENEKELVAKNENDQASIKMLAIVNGENPLKEMINELFPKKAMKLDLELEKCGAQITVEVKTRVSGQYISGHVIDATNYHDILNTEIIYPHDNQSIIEKKKVLMAKEFIALIEKNNCNSEYNL